MISLLMKFMKERRRESGGERRWRRGEEGEEWRGGVRGVRRTYAAPVERTPFSFREGDVSQLPNFVSHSVC